MANLETTDNVLLASSDGLADAGTLDVGPPAAGETWLIEEINTSGTITVDKKVDPGDDDTYEISIQIFDDANDFTGEGLGMALRVAIHHQDSGTSGQSKLTITNTSGGTIDLAVYGTKISNTTA